MRYNIVDNYMESRQKMECGIADNGAMRLPGGMSFTGEESSDVLDLGIMNKIRLCFELPANN